MGNSIEKYFYAKERILYILYVYPHSIFNKNVLYKIYKTMYGKDITYHYISIAADMLVKAGFIQKTKTTKEDLKKNGYRRKLSKKMKTRWSHKYVLTENGERFFLAVKDALKEILSPTEILE